MIKLGLLGCGRIGRVHAQSVASLPDAAITMVADAQAVAAQEMAAKIGAKVGTADEIFNDKTIDAVIIASSTDTHFGFIRQAAQAGKAVFCEKPIDMATPRIYQAIDLVQQAGIVFMTGFNRRFDHSFAALHRRIAQGDVGAVELVAITSRDPAPPPVSYIKQSGGLFRDMMIHDLDMARFLLGEEPASVQAAGSVLVDPAIGAAGDIDTAAVILTTSSGKICQISNSRRASYGYDQRIEVHGAKGMIRAENQLETTVEFADEGGFRRAPAQHFFLERYHGAYSAEMAHFIQAVQGKTAPKPDIHDGLRAQILADAALQSYQTGQAVKVTMSDQNHKSPDLAPAH